MLALAIKHKLGFLKVAAVPAPVPVAVEAKPVAASKKYLFGPRS